MNKVLRVTFIMSITEGTTGWIARARGGGLSRAIILFLLALSNINCSVIVSEIGRTDSLRLSD